MGAARPIGLFDDRRRALADDGAGFSKAFARIRSPPDPADRRNYPMPYRPNYRIERAERDRAKKAKKEEKIKQQQERAAQRKTANPEDDAPPDEPENP
jgi:hypothetical protein